MSTTSAKQRAPSAQRTVTKSLPLFFSALMKDIIVAARTSVSMPSLVRQWLSALVMVFVRAVRYHRGQALLSP